MPGLHDLQREALRFLLATDAACLPRAVRVDFGRCAIVRFLLAADAAFLMFFRVARVCFVEAMVDSLLMNSSL